MKITLDYIAFQDIKSRAREENPCATSFQDMDKTLFWRQHQHVHPWKESSTGNLGFFFQQTFLKFLSTKEGSAQKSGRKGSLTKDMKRRPRMTQKL
jgi:acid phosphatase class B